MPADKKINLVRFAHKLSRASRSCDWNNGTFEHNDFSAKRPFTIEYSIEQALAIYAWLENIDLGNSGDIDAFVFRLFQLNFGFILSYTVTIIR